MNTIERLRPEIRPLDADWSVSTLESILSSENAPGDPARTRRRRLGLVGAWTAALLGIGGVSYATGLVPGFIADELDWISPGTVSNIHEVASFSISTSGKTRSFVIWRGTNAAGQSCTAVLEPNGKFGPNFGGNCGDYPTDAWFDTTREPYKGTIEDTPPPATYFVYGEPALPGVTSVRVIGEGFAHTAAVDPATGGYAVAIPEFEGGVRGHFATVEFVDANGTIVGTSELSER
jgi:hypothetical protein